MVSLITSLMTNHSLKMNVKSILKHINLECSGHLFFKQEAIRKRRNISNQVMRYVKSLEFKVVEY